MDSTVDTSPYVAPSGLQYDPPESQLRFFVDQLRSSYPHVRRVVIETDDVTQSNTLDVEAELVNLMGSAGDATVFIARRQL